MDTLHLLLSQFILILEQLSIIDELILITGPGKPEKTIYYERQLVLLPMQYVMHDTLANYFDKMIQNKYLYYRRS